MSKIKIITDSGCDIPVNIKLNNVEILGFYITADGVSYEERKDITNKEYYKILEECDAIPSTAHITLVRYGEKIEDLANQGVTDIIIVTINSAGSATYESALMAKKMYLEANPDCNLNITVIDSHSYSIGYGWGIIQADKLIDEGKSADEIAEFMKKEFARSEILVSAYSLKFMKKSGRISAIAAFAGEVLGLKPIISLNHGETSLIGKVRGDKMIIPTLVKNLKERAYDTTKYIIGYTDDEYGKELYSACVKEFGVPPMLSIELGSAVSTNTGNHSIGVMYYTGD